MKLRTITSFFLLAVLALAVSCNSADKKKKVHLRKATYSKVDTSINPSNAYNDLFMDSTAVNSYLRADTTLSEELKKAIVSFYNSRNFEYAWFSSEGLPEQTKSFWNLLKNYYNYSDDKTILDKKMDAKLNDLFDEELKLTAENEKIRKMELDLTKYLYQYAEKENENDLNFDLQSLEWYVPKKKMSLDEMVTMAINNKNQYATKNAPSNDHFIKMRDMLDKYKKIKDQGGWDTIHIAKNSIKLGYKGPEIIQLRKRLAQEGFTSSTDSLKGNVYDESLAKAVKMAKWMYGYGTDDTTLSKEFMQDLNMSVDERLQQILINMNRMRWTPLQSNTDQRYLMVNIPEFKLYVMEKGKPAWDMDVVVGKDYYGTTLFTGKLNQVVFNPYWNVPPSIVKNEIMPKLGTDYLARNNMEIVSEGEIPEIRQKPGPTNSLGLVKFLFPNSHNIYMHDSPAKSLFEKDKRMFSHGCIRLKEPAKLAEYLLKPEGGWDMARVQSEMNGGEEKTIKLKDPVPVIITYYTAFAPGEGSITFLEDVYGFDEILAKKMFTNPVPVTRHVGI